LKITKYKKIKKLNQKSLLKKKKKMYEY